MTPPTLPTLTLLGGAALHWPDTSLRQGERERRLERKVAGVLAYLALEGNTPRSALAGLLWPDTPEQTARGNLRQALYRLRRADTELVLGGDLLRLAPELEADAARLEVSAFRGDEAGVAAQCGELLAGHDYDDCPEFLEWLTLQRERLLARRGLAHTRLSEAAERMGDLQGALHHAEARLALDPLSEVGHRRVMALHARLGDRGAALRAFERCVQTLRRELNVAPNEQTRELARTLAQREAAPPPPEARGPAPSPTPSFAAAPLVGRGAEWAALERAWADGQSPLVCGPAGVGKSRLLHDFLISQPGAGQGGLHVFQGRPGDDAVPYLSLARACRALLPGVASGEPSGWVRAELARLLPELAGTDGADRQRLAPDTDPLRFGEALARFLALALEGGPRLLLLDDFQFCDEASRGAWLALLGHPLLAELGVRAGLTYRPDELSAAWQEALDRLAEARTAAIIPLTPLDQGGVDALLDAVLPQVPPGLAAALGRHTGGNPLFLLETLRSLGESGELEGAAAGPLPLPPRIGPIIRRRLARVSASAQRLAQAAAVAGADASPELLAAVLEVPLLELSAPWAELEAAQIMRGAAFAHDLMADAATGSVPVPIRAHLHGRVAAVLERTPGAEAARVAHHWTGAGRPERAAPFLVQAGWDAQRRGAWRAAAQAFRQALTSAPPGSPVHGDALYGLGATLSVSEPLLAEETLNAALAARPGPRREAELRTTLSRLYVLLGRLDESGEQIRRAIEHAPPEVGSDERSALWQVAFWTELRGGRLPQAEAAIRQAQTLAPHNVWVANEHALLLWHAGRFPEAAAMYEELADTCRQHGDTEEDGRAAFGSNRAWTYWALGRNVEADALLSRPYIPPGSPFEEALRLANRSVVLTSQGRSAEALAALNEAEGVMRAYPLHHADLLHRRSVVYHRADRHPQALGALLEGLPIARRVGDPYRLSYTLASLGAAKAHLGDPDAAREHAAEALAIAERIRFPLTVTIAHQGTAVVARLAGDDRAALHHAQSAAAVARHCGLPEQLAQSLLLCGPQQPEALQEALEIGRRHDLPDVIWRAASALAGKGGEYADLARQVEERLRALAPADWD